MLLGNDTKFHDGYIIRNAGFCLENCEDISTVLLKSHDEWDSFNLKKNDNNTPFNHLSEL